MALNVNRSDVAAAYGMPVSDAMCGFEASFSCDELFGSSETAEVSLEAEMDGQTVVVGPQRVSRSRVLSQPVQFQLERPWKDEIVAGPIPVSGWAVMEDGSPVTVKVKAITDGVKLEKTLLFNKERSDVSLVLGETKAGFEHILNWSELGGNAGESQVTVSFIYGANQVDVGPIRVIRAGNPVLRHQRGSYKEVWNGAAAEPHNAMAAVAATTDDNAFFDSGRITASTLSEALDIGADDTVLEIGCGIGRIGLYHAPRCRKWIGTDISGGMLERAAQVLKDQHNVELIELSAGGLAEIADQSVDKLYCSTVFMHLDEWDRYRYVQEAMRVLREGGRCYFDNVNLLGSTGWKVFEEIAAIDPAQRPAAASKLSTPEELVVYLQQAGFRNITLRPGPHYVAAIGTKPLTGDDSLPVCHPEIDAFSAGRTY